jgi:hypothetical protein
MSTGLLQMKIILLPLFAGIVCLVSDTGVRAATGTTSLPIDASPEGRTLTLTERVAYQRAIEEVYCRHRIWPKENPNHKPSLDAMMTQAQLEKKVTDYLHNSQALADYRHRSLTAEELQAEMNRMANHTKRPEVLRELFAALGNDPFVIAECLARRLLTERLLTPLASEQVKQTSRTYEQFTPATGNYSLAQVADVGGCTDDSWTATSITNVPTGRFGHTAVWTGSEMSACLPKAEFWTPIVLF